jgi:anti-anti-sigma factor
MVAKDVEGVHLVWLRGELDMEAADEVRRRLVEIAGSTVDVDLSQLTFIDAAGIRALGGARRDIEHQGDQLVLRQATPFVRRVFRIVGLTELLSD